MHLPDWPIGLVVYSQKLNLWFVLVEIWHVFWNRHNIFINMKLMIQMCPQTKWGQITSRHWKSLASEPLFPFSRPFHEKNSSERVVRVWKVGVMALTITQKILRRQYRNSWDSGRGPGIFLITARPKRRRRTLPPQTKPRSPACLPIRLFILL